MESPPAIVAAGPAYPVILVAAHEIQAAEDWYGVDCGGCGMWG